MRLRNFPRDQTYIQRGKPSIDATISYNDAGVMKKTYAMRPVVVENRRTENGAVIGIVER